MAKLFYSGQAYLGCGNGCNGKMQAYLLDENDQPIDTDWVRLQQIYNDHNAVCSPETPYIDHEDCYYGNPDICYESPCKY